jgi:hypothetical protein
MTGAICDVRFSLQGEYATNGFVKQLAEHAISNAAVTVPGRATLSDNKISRRDFVNAEAEAIREQFARFLDRQGVPRDGDVVVLDMEPRDISPRLLGNYSGAELKALVKAYRLRIKVAREELSTRGSSDFQLAMYQVIVPDGRGRFGAGFEARMCGYREAGSQGMYDQLDAICPVLYHRFGSLDTDRETLHGWIAASTKQAVEQSGTLTRRNRSTIPLVPILSFWVFNPDSSSHRRAVSPDTVALQLEIVRQATGIAAILFWSGTETMAEMKTANEPVEPVDIIRFLTAVGSWPWPGCP